MSAKSSVKSLVSNDDAGKLYRWVAKLTGSKNALKGVGFFLGGALLTQFGFRSTLIIMLTMLSCVLIISLVLLEARTGLSSYKPKFSELFSKSAHINRLSAARFFLFASRDVWFVVALPVFLQSQLNWSYAQVGTLMATWVIGYGFVQSIAPRITGKNPTGKTALLWSLPLLTLPAVIAIAMSLQISSELVVIVGLLAFGAVFAINSSVHSFLIVSWASEDGVSLDVGFYYMANAAGRLLGTVLSGLVYQSFGLGACLLVSSFLIACAAVLSRKL